MSREEFDYPHPLSLQAALDLKSETRQLHWPPGYHSSYSNLGAGYVGRVIEIVTREDYDDWFEREILAALECRFTVAVDKRTGTKPGHRIRRGSKNKNTLLAHVVSAVWWT